ncbi:putative glycolipid-binding domain-containing protein [Cryobacterium sp. 1639]|uniref:putative glycolipid-binding domain-containing protein n=1 Tax=Cryobacterium inferilacus TaxID=2866629 RepID=UPI001C72FFF6|nr:putative glycolipid-binding domain-containing protein [Cryobacterium sp. 1639]MBX0299039.1 putative glycolipid-binding domain-containing protein [Cryobacterium sp. 1639]
MTQSDVAWRGHDDPGRIDRALIEIGQSGMEAQGASITAAYATAWSLDASDAWRTRTVDISAHGAGWMRSLALIRDENDHWTAVTQMHGDADLPPAGLADPGSVDGALDCDIALCPATNTMPIRRLGLLNGNVQETSLVMAWIEVPSLRVFRSDQVYAASMPGRVRFRSASGDFHAELTVDSDGIVIDYPGLATRFGRP